MSLREQLRRLAALPPNRFPFASIYLNLTPQSPGILTYPAFLKKRMGEELRRYPERSPQRISLEKWIPLIPVGREKIGKPDPATFVQVNTGSIAVCALVEQ